MHDPLIALREHGYCVLRRALGPDVVAALDADLDPQLSDLPFCDGDFYGRRTKRLGGLLKRSSLAERLIRHPDVLALVDGVLAPWCDRYALNLTQAIDIHPGALGQYPHRDQEMWHGPKGEIEYLVNVMWPLTRFTRENGGTRLWPGSHRLDWNPVGEEGAVVLDLEPGDVLLFLGSTLHGGGENRSLGIRRGVVVSYCLGWLKPFENQWLVYPPEVARGFDPDLAALVGYAQHRPNLGNVEGRCPSELLWPPGTQPPAADALLPEQTAALGDYVAQQHAARAGLIGG